MMTIDPGAITLIQTTFLQHIADVFGLVTHYAENLLYIFATFEVVVAGLLWALQQGVAWERLFFKVLKIGLIFFIIQNYAYLLHAVLNSFVQLGGIVSDTKQLSQFIFNPAKIWQYGYDMGLQLIQIAVNVNSVALSLLEMVLGLGIVVVFGLLGIQIILQLVGFYLIALIALLFLPLGVFRPSAGMFDRAVQTVLKAGARVMVLIMVIGIAVITWHAFDLVGEVKLENINQPLGLFFTALLFLYLAVKLPQWVADVIGDINTQTSGETTVHTVTVPALNPLQTASGDMAAMQMATSVGPSSGVGSPNVGAPTFGQAAEASHITVTPSQSAVGSALNIGDTKQKSSGKLSKASQVGKNLSETALKQLKKTIREALSEKKSP